MGRYQPAIVGGLFIGILSSLPFVSAGNLCCCLWVVVGGGIAAYLQQQRQPEPLDAADAALGGLLAGLVGAILAIIAAVAIFSAAGDLMQDRLRDLLEQNPQLPPEVRDRFDVLFTGRNIVLLQAAVTLPMYAVFGLIGGLLGRVFVAKRTPQRPPSPDA
ncbi:MAG TPA: DUF5518 domain-containing protein [Vicinamibacterales bacterium]|jgi:hypothetical protein|nr:DUF5518 domain-containing protein [Vicinamibacterales bacterium]